MPFISSLTKNDTTLSAQNSVDNQSQIQHTNNTNNDRLVKKLVGLSQYKPDKQLKIPIANPGAKIANLEKRGSVWHHNSTSAINTPSPSGSTPEQEKGLWASLGITGDEWKEPKKENRPWAAFDKYDLAFRTKQDNDNLEQAAKDVINGIGSVGARFRVDHRYRDNGTQFKTLGDANASMQVIRRLSSLGAKKIRIKLSETANSEKKLNTICNKLSILFPEFDREVIVQHLRRCQPDLPQDSGQSVKYHPENTDTPGKQGQPPCQNQQLKKLMIGDSEVEIFDGAYKTEDNPKLEIGFPDFGSVEESIPASSHYLHIGPFRWNQSPTIHMNKNDEVPVRISRNALLPETKTEIFDEKTADLDEKEWLVSRLECSESAEQLANILSLCREGKIDTGVIYGLHHPDTKHPVSTMKNYLDVLSNRKKQRPNVVFIHDHHCPEASNLGLEPLEPSSKKLGLRLDNPNLAKLIATNSARGDKNPIVCRIPTLPKDVFQHMIRNSSLPALVEGANTTTQLLLEGKPYLSVLPGGRTSIPLNMGSTLEAAKTLILSRAVSSHSDTGAKRGWEKVYQLVEEKKFSEALDYMDEKYKLLDIDIGTMNPENTEGGMHWKELMKEIITILRSGDTEKAKQWIGLKRTDRFTDMLLVDHTPESIAKIVGVKIGSDNQQQTPKKEQPLNLHDTSQPDPKLRQILKLWADKENDKKPETMTNQLPSSNVNPAPVKTGISDYIDDCQDENSAMSHHLLLQKHHLQQTFNDPVVMSLIKYGKLLKKRG